VSNIKKILLVILLVFIFLLKPVYANYTISNIVVDETVYTSQDFNVSVFVSNNTDSVQNIDYNITIFASNNEIIYQETRPVTNVSEYSVKADVIEFSWDPKSTKEVVSTPTINNIHLVQASISPSEGGYSPGNIKRFFFMISKGQRKIPVPDMPIIFSFLLVGFISFILIKKPIKK
jgi:hypothetical protein